MEERSALMRAYDSGAFTGQELADQFGVNRETFYTWLQRRNGGDDRQRAGTQQGP